MRAYGPKYGVPQEPGYQAEGAYQPNEYFMQMAINYAKDCVGRGQHPVGAVVTRVQSMPTIVEGSTEPESIPYELVAGVGVNEVDTDSTRHAEKVALQKAELYHGRRRLGELQSVLYTTHEPCPMCAGAIANSKLHGVVYGTSDADARELVRTEGIRWRSNRVSGLDIIRGRLEVGAPEQFIIGGFMRKQCLELLKTAGRLAISRPSPTQNERFDVGKLIDEVYKKELAAGANPSDAENTALQVLFNTSAD